MASRDVVLRRWEHSTGRSGASGACGTVVRNLYLTYLTTKQPCFHSFPCRVAPKRPLVYSHSVSRDNRRRVRYESRRRGRGAEKAAGGFSCFSTIRRSRISILPGPLSSSRIVNSRHDARATYTAKPQTTAQLEAASSWTREAGGASRWAFRLSKTPLLARFHSNGESGRLDEVRGRRRWVGVLVVVELLRI